LGAFFGGAEELDADAKGAPAPPNSGRASSRKEYEDPAAELASLKSTGTPGTQTAGTISGEGLENTDS
jgi:hypothetical protein